MPNTSKTPIIFFDEGNNVRHHNIFRDTFGIIDPVTKKKYKDIIHSFLLASYITVDDYDRGYFKRYGYNYRLQCDPSVRKELGMNGAARCIISFQHRTNGLFAMARLFDESLSTSNKE